MPLRFGFSGYYENQDYYPTIGNSHGGVFDEAHQAITECFKKLKLKKNYEIVLQSFDFWGTEKPLVLVRYRARLIFVQYETKCTKVENIHGAGKRFFLTRESVGFLVQKPQTLPDVLEAYEMAGFSLSPVLTEGLIETRPMTYKKKLGADVSIEEHVVEHSWVE